MDEFDEICRRCTPVVYRFLLSLCKDASLADELTAETFYQAYLHIGTFRGDCRVESWLCQIAKNALTKELRRQRRAVPFEETHELAAPDDIFELLADKEQAMRIHASLHRLKEPYRESSRCACSVSCTFATLPTCSANPSPGQRSHFTAPRTS